MIHQQLINQPSSKMPPEAISPAYQITSVPRGNTNLGGRRRSLKIPGPGIDGAGPGFLAMEGLQVFERNSSVVVDGHTVVLV